MIDSYDFGRMKINGITYTSDVIVFADHVKSDWWRIEGHKLHVKDLNEVIETKPDILVVGTGYYGLMKVLHETEKHLKAEGVQLVAEKTREASHTYNKLSTSKNVVGVFHLTC